MNNQHIIDQINALEPCGAKLRAVLLALAGAPEPKPAPDLPYCLPADVLESILYLCDQLSDTYPTTVDNIFRTLAQTRAIR